MNKPEPSIEELKDDYKALEQKLAVVSEKLLRAEELKSDFLSNIKNEINNPLTSILGLLKHNISNPAAIEQNQKNAQLIFEEVYSLNFQIRNIFMAAEVEAGQAFPEFSNINLNRTIDQVIDSFDHLVARKKIEFDRHYEASESIVTDREKIEVIIANLISNAIKFSKEGARVVIQTSQDAEGNMVIAVQDFGVGIDDGFMDEIYDRFKQLDSGTRKEFGGHGLGLAIVNSLVELMDGSMAIESNVGKGTRLDIKLPPKEAQIGGEEEDEILFTNSEEEGEIF